MDGLSPVKVIPLSSEDIPQAPLPAADSGDAVAKTRHKHRFAYACARWGEGRHTVYNLEIYKDHNFLVATDKILVHNSCITKAPDPSAAHKAIKNKWGHEMSGAEMNEIQNTVDRIKRGDRSAYPSNDGTPFQNSHEISPDAKRLNTGETYTEWTVRTPGVGNRGTRRIVVSNQTGRAYYSHNHYIDYIEIDLSKW